MKKAELEKIIAEQKKYFASGVTREMGFRLKALKKLKNLLLEYDGELQEAFRKDLGKHPAEAWASEHGLAVQELGIVIRNLRRWANPKRVYTPVVHWPAGSFYRYQPYGRTLIISPWNYPLQLLLMPMIGAIAAGNCVLAKPSRHSVNVNRILLRIFSENFDPGHIFIIPPEGEVNSFILDYEYDYIFFTGSSETGKKVMKAASEFLTPVSLELGGKSPVIVEPDSDPSLAARRILWGKLLNSGQSCVAPDYLLVHKDIKEPLLDEMKKYLLSAYGEDIKSNPDYGRMIKPERAAKLTELLKGKQILIGGGNDPAERFISPTVVEADSSDELMKSEIFGPVLPLLEYENLDEALEIIEKRPAPLALYLFTRSRKVQRKIINSTRSGSGAINETVVHYINPYLPFGGVGGSGMGRYHGKYSFETFSYRRSFIDKALWLDIPFRYPPYRKKLKIFKTLIR